MLTSLAPQLPKAFLRSILPLWALSKLVADISCGHRFSRYLNNPQVSQYQPFLTPFTFVQISTVRNDGLRNFCSKKSGESTATIPLDGRKIKPRGK